MSKGDTVTPSTTKLSTAAGTKSSTPIKAAVMLAGAGVYDGSEITETTSILIALSK